jgi:hypothetical protein
MADEDEVLFDDVYELKMAIKTTGRHYKLRSVTEKQVFYPSPSHVVCLLTFLWFHTTHKHHQIILHLHQPSLYGLSSIVKFSNYILLK